MKILIVPVVFLGALAVAGCESRTVVMPPNAAVVTTPAIVTPAVPVPGPAGPPGPQGATGRTGDTVVVVPPSSESAKN